MLSSKLYSFKYQCFVITALCLISYGYSLQGEFVFDDSVAIVKNPDVTNLHTVNITQIFQHDFWGYKITDKSSHKSYRPFTILMFRAENLLFGLNPTMMKIVNLFLHIVISCGLIWVYNEILDGSYRLVPFFGAILFAVHPIHTEAVSGIVGRAELLNAIVFILIFYIYSHILAKSRHSWLLWLVLLCLSAISLGVKENGITILPFMIVFDIIRNFKSHFDRQLVLRVSFLACYTLVLMYYRLKIINFQSPIFKRMDNPVAAHEQLTVRILSQNYLYAFNFWLLVCPDWLSFDWAFGSIPLVESVSDPRIYSIILFYIFIASLLISRNKEVYLGFALILIPFLPACGIIKVGFVVAERILYTPSIGYCLLIALGVDRIQYNINRKAALTIFLVITLIFTFRTIERSNHWKDEDRLFKSGLRVCPNNAKVYYNIAKLSADRDEKAVAFTYYHKAIELYPKYESAIMNLGSLYRDMGDFRRAEKYLEESIQILEEFPTAWMNLGIVKASLDKFDESLKCYHRALSYRKRYPICLYNLGNLYIKLKNDTMAMKSWQEAISLDPKQAKAWANILALLDNKNLMEDVIKTSEQALLYNPDDPAILFTRANAFGKMDKFAESEEIFKAIIRLRPTYALYYANLGVLYHRWGKTDKAVDSYRQALHLDPHLKSAHDNLVKLTNKAQG